MEYLNKIYIMLILIILWNCKQINTILDDAEESNDRKNLKELSDEEWKELSVGYNLIMGTQRPNDLLDYLDPLGSVNYSYGYELCSQFDVTKKKFMIQINIESERILFDVKKNPYGDLFISNEKFKFLVKKLIPDTGNYPDLEFHFTDANGKDRKFLAGLIMEKDIDECIERQQSIYESEKQFVEQQNNDGE
jgi:hypothetical protein